MPRKHGFLARSIMTATYIINTSMTFAPPILEFFTGATDEQDAPYYTSLLPRYHK
jgi:hypothetical protein